MMQGNLTLSSPGIGLGSNFTFEIKTEECDAPPALKSLAFSYLTNTDEQGLDDKQMHKDNTHVYSKLINTNFKGNKHEYMIVLSDDLTF
jgi:hypothetical protein